MSLTFSRRILYILLIGGIGWAAHAQTYTESKQIKRTFPVGPDTRLDVTNKYGRVQIIPWKKDSASIEVDLFVRSNSLNKLEKLQDNIDFEFTGTQYYIIARTNFGNKYNSFFTDLKDLSTTLIPSKNKVEIDYTIRIPSNMPVNISNKYGDLYMDDLKGPVNINLANGDIKVNRLEGEANINLNFGNGIINYYHGGKLTLSYADVEIKEAGSIDIDSKSSKVRVREAGVIKLQSRRDKVSATNVKNLFGEAYFSDIWISVLSEETNFTPKYGDFKVDLVEDGFSFINLNSEYTDVNLMFSRESSYSIDLIYHPEAIVRYPMEEGSIELVEETDDYVRVRGQVGETGQSRVKITAPKKCIITLDKR